MDFRGHYRHSLPTSLKFFDPRTQPVAKKGLRFYWNQFKARFKEKCVREPFWLPFFAVCFTFFLIQAFDCIQKIRSPRKLTTSRAEASEYPMVPAFTFCSLRPFDLEKIKDLGFEVELEDSYLSQVNPMYWNWSSLRGRKISNLTKLFESVVSNYSVIPFDDIAESMTPKYHFQMNGGLCVTWVYSNQTFEQKTGMDVFGFILTAPPSHRKNLGNTFTPSRRKLKIKLTEVQRQDGWIMYVHDERERWRGLSRNSKEKENLFIIYHEHMFINLAVTDFKVIDEKSTPCNDDENHSKAVCEFECVSKQVTQQYECTAPWLFNYNNISECSDPLIVGQMVEYTEESLFKKFQHLCTCKRRCLFREYQTTIRSIAYDRSQGSSSDEEIISTIGFRFAMGKVQYVSEYWGYDFNQFIADMGGSVGLFLGLSIMSCSALPAIVLRSISEMCCKKKRRGTKIYNSSAPQYIFQPDRLNAKRPNLWKPVFQRIENLK